MKRTVLITGCSSGFGLATARHFARHGWRVFASMRNPDRDGIELRNEAAAAGWELHTPALDVTRDDQVAQVVSALGPLDVLVNNAGYFCVGPVEDTTPAELQAQLDTNVLGALRLCRAVLPAFRAAGRGRIINVSSLAALAVVPMLGPYHASKMALQGLTEALAFEVAPFGLHVSAVLPGPFSTQLTAKQVRVAASQAPGSVYKTDVDRFESLNARVPKGNIESVMRAIYKAATVSRPKLRYAVGPLSLLATYGYPVTPQWLYAFLVRKVFRLRARK
ncbi:MAG: SDR family oxidoreductase [Deltaproteobacteria bacterium]|nr:SDR family oxidoreductase [Deltaproteobacteria bacterium]